jgi:hypothetical protein
MQRLKVCVEISLVRGVNRFSIRGYAKAENLPNNKITITPEIDTIIIVSYYDLIDSIDPY